MKAKTESKMKLIVLEVSVQSTKHPTQAKPKVVADDPEHQAAVVHRQKSNPKETPFCYTTSHLFGFKAPTSSVMPQPAAVLFVVLLLALQSCWNLGAAFQPAPAEQLYRQQRRIGRVPFASSSPTTSTRLEAITAIVAGATGYIGKSVVRESVRRGYRTIALVRDKNNKAIQEEKYYKDAIIVECDVTDEASLLATFRSIKTTYGKVDAVLSCLASRSGVKKDAYKIDYQATLNCVNAGRAIAANRFVLLSAYCVKNPTLQFQQAKLKLEAALTSQTDLSYTIVRPTAFFKSVSGQLEVVQSGAPFVMFGDGAISRCNPIAESDLATYLVDSIENVARHNQIINLGGPDDGFTMAEQGKMLFDITGRPEKYINAPVWIFDIIINGLQLFADLFHLEALEDAAETGRIGKYYAVEDMLTTDPNEKYGTITLRQHYERIAQYGQEYDPYTTMFARAARVDAKTIREEKEEPQTETIIEPHSTK
jgi:divinyl chlorophyllide a 8-vinyl-reductase